MLKKVIDLTTQDFSKGLNTDPNPFSLAKEESPNMMNVKALRFGSLQKRLGSNTQNLILIVNSAAAGFSPTGAITDNLLAYWNLNEAAGTRRDSVGTSHLSDNGNVGQASGIRNSSASFKSSSNQYLLLTNTSSVSVGDADFSIAGWFYLDSTSTTIEQTIVAKRDTSGQASGNADFLLHADGTDGSVAFSDSSMSPKAITSAGNVQIDTSQSKFGGASAQFDGTGDYLDVADNAAWDFGTGDFTIDFWCRFATTVGTQELVDIGLDPNGVEVFQITSETNTTLYFRIDGGATDITKVWSPESNRWYHLAATRSSNTARLFIDGIQQASATDSNDIQQASGVRIGESFGATRTFNGWIDEVRIIKGTSAFNANFTVASTAYSDASTITNFEYWLYVNTDQQVVFRVSSSGTAHNGSIVATSFGAVTTSTFYNVVAYHDAANDLIAAGINLSMNSGAYASGVRAGSAPFVVGAISNGVSAFMNGRVDELGFWGKVLSTTDRSNLYNSGSGNTFGSAFGQDPWASFDFGAAGNRWLTVAAGTGIYASSDLGVNWVNIATDRTANYQYFERSKNVLVSGSDSYDRALIWPGSAGTFMLTMNTAAPLVKYFINFQGFLIGLNSSTRKRGFFYEDENSQLTGDWGDAFDIPTSHDDEITAGFVLRKRLYVSTRYKLYAVSYVGGNPDWSYREIKDWGFVPRTVKKLYLKDVGEVACGMDWARKLRIFDGSDDKIISDKIENDNRMCEFAMSKVSYAGSGLVVSFAETDYNDNVYKLCVAIGENSTATTHFVNFDGRVSAFYPYSNMPFNTMTMAESGGRRYLMAFDRGGRCHMLDSGNLDRSTTAINDIYESPLIFEKSPAQSSKSHKIDLFFDNNSAGNIYLQDRIDYSDTFKAVANFYISGSDKAMQIHKSLDIPQGQNTYQYQISSSSGTKQPWLLNRMDYFQEPLGIGKNA